MGGDFAPGPILAGVAEALDMYGESCRLLLAGPLEAMRSGLQQLGKGDDPRVELVEAPDVIGMDEHPAQAVRAKPKSSINVVADLVKNGRADGVFSAGNTGAMVSSAYLKWRMLPGIERPAIMTVIPSETGRFLLLDSGATVDCTPHMLAQFAVMGDICARKILGVSKPRVGLLSNGTEEGKGNALTNGAYERLSTVKDLNFLGNIEGHDLFSGHVDVVVCDGFVGNVVLKCSEQLAKSMGQMIKAQIMSKFFWKVGGLLSSGAFQAFKQTMDPAETGGAPLLGVQGCCVIGHGNSNAKAVRNGIRVVRDLVNTNVNSSIVEALHAYGLDFLPGS